MRRGYERDPAGLPRSLWAEISPPVLPLQPLSGVIRTHVAIVGAGYTGLSCALHLRERGIECSSLSTSARERIEVNQILGSPGFGW